jgi:hypothetical protein
MKKVECRCGKASMTYEVTGEDQWTALAVNTKVTRRKYSSECQCKICGSVYDDFDFCNVVSVEHKNS